MKIQVIATIVALSLAGSEAICDEPNKVPSADEISKATKEIDSVFADQIKAAKTPEQTNTIINKMWNATSQEVGANRYVLIRKIATLAIDNGDSDRAFLAIRVLMVQFKVNKIELFKEMVSKLIPKKVGDQRAAWHMILTLLDLQLDVAKFEDVNESLKAALKTLEFASKFVEKKTYISVQRSQYVTAKIKWVKEFSHEYNNTKTDQEKLKVQFLWTMDPGLLDKIKDDATLIKLKTQIATKEKQTDWVKNSADAFAELITTLDGNKRAIASSKAIRFAQLTEATTKGITQAKYQKLAEEWYLNLTATDLKNTSFVEFEGLWQDMENDRRTVQITSGGTIEMQASIGEITRLKQGYQITWAPDNRVVNGYPKVLNGELWLSEKLKFKKMGY